MFSRPPCGKADSFLVFQKLPMLSSFEIRITPYCGWTHKRADRLKLLYWDEDGFVIVYKRLEVGSFRFPTATTAGLEVRAADLQMLLDGIDLDSVKRSRRYRRPLPA
jgi:hypothetical protein